MKHIKNSVKLIALADHVLISRFRKGELATVVALFGYWMCKAWKETVTGIQFEPPAKMIVLLVSKVGEVPGVFFFSGGGGFERDGSEFFGNLVEEFLR